MKTIHKIAILIVLMATSIGNAQFLDKLGKSAERAAQRTIERRVERETTKSTDRVLDTIVDAPKKSKKEKRREAKNRKNSGGNVIGGNSNNQNTSSSQQSSGGLEEVGENEVNFKRGNRIIFSDNFEKDALGDFPAKWNSTRGGEVKKLNGFNSKFLKIPAESVINIQLTKPLPENFTVECEIILPSEKKYRRAGIGFGAKPDKIDNTISSFGSINFDVNSVDDKNFFEPYTLNYSDKKLGIGKNKIQYKAPLNQAIKLAFEVNGKRIRMFVDGKKMIDLPTAFEPDYRKAIFFNSVTSGHVMTKDSYFYLSNIVIAETTSDERSGILKDLMEKGSFSTNAILFNSGSATIKSGSDSILKEIGEAMQGLSDMRIKIVGHTDSDGDSASNQKLSEERAKSVRTELVNKYGINISRIQTDGKGESNPVADNASSSGKEQNRRVEFIKL